MNKKSDEKKTAKNSPDIGLWIVYGLMAGTVIGVVTDNLVLWAGIGMCLGIMVGAITRMNES